VYVRCHTYLRFAIDLNLFFFERANGEVDILVLRIQFVDQPLNLVLVGDSEMTEAFVRGWRWCCYAYVACW
jgi:hypothetical protein